MMMNKVENIWYYSIPFVQSYVVTFVSCYHFVLVKICAQTCVQLRQKNS